MYRVIKYFTDLQDDNYPYEVGSIYPRKALSVSKARLAELSSKNNKQGTPLIVDIGGEEVKTVDKVSETPKSSEPLEDNEVNVKVDVKKTEQKPKRKTSKKKDK